MKRIAFILLSVSFLLVFSACSKSPEKTVTSFLDDMTDIVKSNEGNCDKMAQKMNALVDSKGENLTEAIKVLAKEKDESKGDELSDSMNKLGKAIENSKCSNDIGVSAVQMKLGLLILGGAMAGGLE